MGTKKQNPAEAATMAEILMGGLMNENAVLRRTGKDAITNFLRKKNLYEVLRRSGKVRDMNQLAVYFLIVK
jgi:phosphoribosyl-AMP cyclohydrolase